MRTRHRKLLVAGILLAVLVVVAGLLFDSRQVPEPSYNGKSLTEWLKLANYMDADETFAVDTNTLTNPSIGATLQARGAIRHMGTNAIPKLLEMIATRDSATKRFFVRHFPPDWAERLHRGEAYRQYTIRSSVLPMQAIAGFKILGPTASNAVPELGRILVTSDNNISRVAANLSLALIGPPARAAIPDLVRALKNPDPGLQIAVSSTIHELCYDYQTSDWRPDCVSILLPELTAVLKDPHADVYGTLNMLSILGPVARPAIPAILPYLNSNSISPSYGGLHAIQNLLSMPITSNSNDYRFSTVASNALRQIDPTNSALRDPSNPKPDFRH